MESVTRCRRIPPVWLMGLAYLSYGMVTGFSVFSLAQTLAARHVPESTIASVTAIVASPTFFIFFASPILDVWFSRRAYATGLTAVAAALLGASVLLLRNLLLVEVALFIAMSAITMATFALGGWLSAVVTGAAETQLGAWITVANTAGFGLMSLCGADLVQYVPAPLVALVLATLVILPGSIFLLIPSRAPDERLAKETFRAFNADILALLRRREVVIALVLFVLPCGTFSLTNVLGGLGNEFQASQRLVSLLGGAGSAASGIAGSLLLPVIAKRMPLRPLYLIIGVAGGLFTLSLLLLSRTPGTFALAVLGENAIQSIEIACSLAIAFEIIGKDNPLAATNYAFLSAAFNVPIFYMALVDGWGYSKAGIIGEFGADAALGIAASLAMGALLALGCANRPAKT